MPGIRMISPAHFFDTAFGGSAHGLEQGGLTAKGREMIRRMEARGVLLDVAHSSARTIDDALAVSTRPVVASHTGVRGVLDNARNLSDAHLDGIAATGGLVGIGFWPTASGGEDAAAIARSIAYAVERVGAEHVALGLRLGRRRARPVRRGEHGPAHRRAAGRGPRRGGDPRRDGRERPAGPGGGAARRAESRPARVRYPRAMRTTERTVLNPSGLHARPAAMFVKTAAGFASKITLENLDRGAAPVDAKSMLVVMGAGSARATPCG